MLKNIPPILSPELLQVLNAMGHGDELVLGDGNFPAAAIAQRLVRADGHGVPELLDAILQLFPLDIYDGYPVALMQVVPGDPVGSPPVWNTYNELLAKHEGNSLAICQSKNGGQHPVAQVERFAFYARAKQAYAVVATGETALYANIILKKGVVV